MCMYVFKGDHLVLDNQLVCSSLGKATSLVPSFPQLPIPLCAGFRPHELLPVHSGMFIGIILFSSHFNGQVDETLRV